MYSLRRTLAVRFSLTIFAALLAIALWAYLGARGILQDALDQNLATAANLETAVLASRLPIAIQPGPPDLAAFVRSVNRFVAVRNESGEILETNTVLAADLPLDAESFDLASAGTPRWKTQAWGRLKLRSYYAPVPVGSRPRQTVLQVAAALDPLHTATREVLLLMLGTVLLGTVAAALGAGWLAESSVAPVLEITRQAQSIQPGAGRRITAHADVDEFAGLVEVLNGALVRLERAFEAQRRMIADAGHDLRTPLTAMRGELEVALRGERRLEEYRAVLTSVLEEVDHLTSLSESLTLLARLEAGELALERVETELGPVVERAARTARGRAGSRAIRFKAPSQEVGAAVDAAMLTVVLDQLLDNAIKHTPAATQIELSLATTADGVTIAVEDSGPGLDDEALAHLFEYFFRPDTARTRTGAVGLGLTIAAAIVRAHGGEIRAERSGLGGLRVLIALPSTIPTV